MTATPEIDGKEWTTGRLLAWTCDFFTRKGVEEARLAAEVLLAHAAECRRIDLYTRFDTELDEQRRARFRELVKRAADGEPIAYLVGEKEFFSLSFSVTPAVLIPRPETETVVEAALEHCAAAGLENPCVWDLGTGSGCIAVAILTQLKRATAVATDISADALALARENALRHGVADRFTVIAADSLAIPQSAVPAGGFDVLVSNPPYVPDGATGSLPVTVSAYEPRAALAGGDDGLTFYRRIAEGAAGLLAPAGVVIVEVGDGRAATAVAAMNASGPVRHVRTYKDRVVGKDRVLLFALAGTGAAPGAPAESKEVPNGAV